VEEISIYAYKVADRKILCMHAHQIAVLHLVFTLIHSTNRSLHQIGVAMHDSNV